MVLIDKTNFELVWKTAGDVSLNGKKWSVLVQEFAADGIQSGFKMSAKYQFKRISHFNVNFDGQPGAKSKGYAFFPPANASDYDVKVSCWSPECPPYIRQNGSSLYTDLVNPII